MQRFGAFGIHLAISLVIFGVLAYLIVAVWYPGFLFSADGGWQGIRIIILVDLVLGPLLTLIVYKPGKPGLATDLTFIGCFQAACLFAGTYIVYSERPIAVVYSDGYFTSMTEDAYRDYGQPVPDLSYLPGTTPKWVSVALPDDPHEQSEIRLGAWRDGTPLRAKADFYVPFSTAKIDLEADAYPITEVQARDANLNLLDGWIEQHGGDVSDHAFFPLGTRYKYQFLAIDKPTREILGVLDIPAPTKRDDVATSASAQS